MFKLPVQIKEGIENYSKAIEDFIDGKISWARFSGIRVPWGNYSHRGGEVFMGRIRIPGGTLAPEQLKALSYCAENFGDGSLHFTTRQDIQLHGVKLENIIQIHKYLKDYELSSRGGGGNTIRNITSCPLAGICEDEVFDVREDAISLSEYLLSQDTSYNLPRKFKIAFSGCEIDCSGCLVNDVGLSASNKNGKSGYKVFVGGGMGAKSSLGKILEEFIEREELGNAMMAIKNVFYKYGDRKNKHHNRLRFLINDLGFEKFKEYYEKELEDIADSEYATLRKISFSYPQGSEEDTLYVQNKDFDEFLKYNCKEQKQKGLMMVKLRIPQGDLEAKKAFAIADFEDEFKGLEFRTSQEQNLIAFNINKKDLYKFYNKLKSIMDDFLYPQTLLDVVACKGSATCNLGLCNSPALAKEIEKVINKDFIDTKIFDKLNIKISGCPNACSQHPLGLVALQGIVRKVSERPVPFYKLLLGGRKDLLKTSLAKDTGILIPAKSVPLFLKDFFVKINEQLTENLDIHKYIEEEGEKIAKEIANKYSYVPPHSENKDFYIDWGRQKEFSLEGIGPGECGAGVLDMIGADLTEAKIAIDEAEKQNYSPREIKKALFLSARALLIVKGKDPKNEEEAFSGFKEKFIDEKIASHNYSGIREIFASIGDNLKKEERKEKFLYTKDFLEHINQLYKGMDSSFNFPQQKEKSEEKTANFLDLKGTPCPLNYVKAKLFLENLDLEEIVEILLDEGEPINNVPKSLESDGQQLIKIEKENGFYKVVVKKKK